MLSITELGRLGLCVVLPSHLLALRSAVDPCSRVVPVTSLEDLKGVLSCFVDDVLGISVSDAIIELIVDATAVGRA